MRGLGLNAISFAFFLSGGGGCTPTWNGNTPINHPSIIGPIKQFTSSGGSCIVTFGGHKGTYLENVCGSSYQLANAYESALTATGCNHIDLDLEQDPVNNNIGKISQALKILQRRKGCIVSYTLAADENGLNSMGIAILKSAASQGVNVDTINPMCMNLAPSGTYDAGVIKCAKAVYNNVASIWGSSATYSMLSVTPMIDKQDNGHRFSLQGMRDLVNWALENHIGRLAFWSLNRDNGDCAGSGSAHWACSGISQNRWDFTRALMPFCKGGIQSNTPRSTSISTKAPRSNGSRGANNCSSGSTSYTSGKCNQKFYQCNHDRPIMMSCGAGTVYNPTSKVCDWPNNISGCS